MKTIRVYRLTNLSPTRFRRLKEAQKEAARVWNLCMQTHKQARLAHTSWPGQRELEHATKGRFALNAQAVQQIVHAFLANIETTRTLLRNAFNNHRSVTIEFVKEDATSARIIRAQ